MVFLLTVEKFKFDGNEDDEKEHSHKTINEFLLFLRPTKKEVFPSCAK